MAKVKGRFIALGLILLLSLLFIPVSPAAGIPNEEVKYLTKMASYLDKGGDAMVKSLRRELLNSTTAQK